MFPAGRTKYSQVTPQIHSRPGSPKLKKCNQLTSLHTQIKRAPQEPQTGLLRDYFIHLGVQPKPFLRFLNKRKYSKNNQSKRKMADRRLPQASCAVALLLGSLFEWANFVNVPEAIFVFPKKLIREELQYSTK